ncbi:MAG TPA: Ig-like domain-containing protein [Verrucomicrobiae bacterium]|jgi:hypothetical protein
MHKKLLLSCLVTGTLAFANLVRADVPVPNVEILATDPVALDSTSTAAFTVIRDGDTNADLTVELSIGGTATNGEDYATTENEVVIPAGYLAVDIPIYPFIDLMTRGNKTIVMGLQANANYQFKKHRTATVTLVDDVYDNPLPTVTIIDPTNNAPFGYPASITITADASDGGTNISSVSFYADDQFLGSVTSAPYTVTWTKAKLGKHTLFARAVDSLFQSTLSAPVQITVSQMLPTVSITSPTGGQVFPAHSNVSITANVADPNPSASVSSVTFYANGHSVGTATTAPYTFTWNGPSAGIYDLQALVTDSVGGKGYSKPVIFSVKGSH